MRQLQSTSSSAVIATPSAITLTSSRSPAPSTTAVISTSTALSASSAAASASTPTPSSSTPSNSQPPADPDGSPKYVVAHHIVGNTFPYTQTDWANDITLALASGIDGFALNIGVDDWQPARVADAYEAARQSGTNFKLFFSLDMSSLPCASPNDAQLLRTLVTNYTTHPNQLLYNSRAFVSTFAGESCSFGQGSVPQGWQTQFTGHPEIQGQIFFVPAFFVDPATFNDFADVMDGDFNFNSGWPIELTTSFADSLTSNTTNTTTPIAAGTGKLSSLLGNAPTQVAPDLVSSLGTALSKFIGSNASDTQHLDSLAAISRSGLGARAEDGEKKAYMAAVSPWFFTHYGSDSFNKNFIYLSDQHLYPRRWESIISSRDQFDIVEILTWNDYGESHYIGPIEGTQPNSQAWVNGLNHTGWLEMTKYYATAFKTGAFPMIQEDKIYIWSRTHPANAQTSDPVGPPTNFELFEDAMWAVVMTTAPSTVTLTTSPTSTNTFSVPAGLTKLSVPISAGGTMYGKIERGGQVVVELKPEGFLFDGNPKTYNYNAFVASAGAGTN